MPAQLSLNFSKDSGELSTQTLMDSENALATSLDEAAASEILNACALQNLRRNLVIFFALYTSFGAVFADWWRHREAGQPAENWGGKLFNQLKKPPFNTVLF